MGLECTFVKQILLLEIRTASLWLYKKTHIHTHICTKNVYTFARLHSYVTLNARYNVSFPYVSSETNTAHYHDNGEIKKEGVCMDTGWPMMQEGRGRTTVSDMYRRNRTLYEHDATEISTVGCRNPFFFLSGEPIARVIHPYAAYTQRKKINDLPDVLRRRMKFYESGGLKKVQTRLDTSCLRK